MLYVCSAKKVSVMKIKLNHLIKNIGGVNTFLYDFGQTDTCFRNPRLFYLFIIQKKKCENKYQNAIKLQ